MPDPIEGPGTPQQPAILLEALHLQLPPGWVAVEESDQGISTDVARAIEALIGGDRPDVTPITDRLADRFPEGQRPHSAEELLAVLEQAGRAVEATSCKLRPAPATRAWIEALPERWARRCLPMMLANQAGWEVLAPALVKATWDGGTGVDAVRISPDGAVASSIFGHGILTFHTGYLWRTSPGIDLWVRGPVNEPKDGIAALEGLVETDWANATFTMNWKFTRPTTVTWEAGEPFCALFPTSRGWLERVRPVVRFPSADEWRAAQGWAASRRQHFAGQLEDPDPRRWQGDYFRGKGPAGQAPADHQTKLRLRPFMFVAGPEAAGHAPGPKG